MSARFFLFFLFPDSRRNESLFQKKVNVEEDDSGITLSTAFCTGHTDKKQSLAHLQNEFASAYSKHAYDHTLDTVHQFDRQQPMHLHHLVYHRLSSVFA